MSRLSMIPWASGLAFKFKRAEGVDRVFGSAGRCGLFVSVCLSACKDLVSSIFSLSLDGFMVVEWRYWWNRWMCVCGGGHQ